MNLSDHLFVILTLNTSSLHWFTSLCFCVVCHVCVWARVCERVGSKQERDCNAYVSTYMFICTITQCCKSNTRPKCERMKVEIHWRIYFIYFSRLHEFITHWSVSFTFFSLVSDVRFCRHPYSLYPF